MTKITLTCMRLSDMRRIHPLMSREHQCDRCHAPLGIYPSGQEHLRQYGRANVELVCNVCTENPPDPSKITAEHLIEMTQSIPKPTQN